MWYIMLTVATIFMIVYCICSLFLMAKIGFVWKLAGCAVIIIAALKWQWFDLLGGSTFLPDIPWKLWILLETAFNCLVSLVMLLILVDLVHIAIIMISNTHAAANIPWKKIKAVLCLLALFIGSFGTWQAVRVAPVHEIKFTSANLPAQLRGFKIAQLSDLHIQQDTPEWWLKGIVEKVNALKPDIVVLTGDIADGCPDAMQKQVAPLAQIKSVYGVYGVSGNHELYWNYNAWISEYEKLGIQMLENKSSLIDVRSAKIRIFGLRDPGHLGNHENMPINIRIDRDADFVLGLIHQPKAAIHAKDMADLILSGHTHGGQFLPLMPLVKWLNAGMVYGLYDNIYVSPGTALWRGFSFRLGTVPEITLFVLE